MPCSQTARHAGPTGDGGALDPVDDVIRRHREVVLAALEDLPWADVDAAVRTVDEGLAFALDLTAADFRFWHEHIEPLGYEDEFNRTLLRDLPAEWRLALVARLLRSIAMSYGLTTD